MNPQARNSFLKTALFFLLIMLAAAVFSALLQNLKTAITQRPKEKLTVIQELVIGGTKITFKPLALSYSGREEQHELILDSNVYDIPLKIVGDAGNPEQIAILRLNPKFNPSKPSIYVRDRRGNEWDLYPTSITFEWRIPRNDPRFLEYFKSIARTYTAIKFKPISNIIRGPHVKIMCPSDLEDACYSIFINYLEFVIPIEVLEILPAVEEIKKAA